MRERFGRTGLAAALFAGLLSAVTAAGCTMHRTTPGTAIDMSVISEHEIDSVHLGSALETIKLLRPMFLVSRGKLTLDPGTPPALPNVYVDDQFYGDATVLRNIPSSTIEYIRFYSAAEAQYKFGRGNDAGVIGIYTKH